jgi:hypothetical protein
VLFTTGVNLPTEQDKHRVVLVVFDKPTTTSANPGWQSSALIATIGSSSSSIRRHMARILLLM